MVVMEVEVEAATKAEAVSEEEKNRGVYRRLRGRSRQ